MTDRKSPTKRDWMFKPKPKSQKPRPQHITATVHFGKQGPQIIDCLSDWAKDAGTNRSDLIRQIIIHALAAEGYEIDK